MDRILKKRLNGLYEAFDFVEEREAIYAPAMLAGPQPIGSEPRLIDSVLLSKWALLVEKKSQLSESIFEGHRKLVGSR